MAKEIFIFRHGETDWNREERFQGHTDIPLNDTGRAQALRLIGPLRQRGIEAILSSDLSRARETAEIVAQALGIPVHVHAGLREAHLGVAQGLTRQEIERQLGREIADRWRSNQVTDADVSYPGGEAAAVVLSRSRDAIREFARTHPCQRFGVASHGGVIRRLMHSLLNAPGAHVPIPNGILYPLYWHSNADQLTPAPYTSWRRP
ncbi:MAG: histidine phosphatase family protein [Bacteriovoracia bacterium]